MEPIYREKTQDTPDVILDIENNKFYIGGRSLAENPVEFYKPIGSSIRFYATRIQIRILQLHFCPNNCQYSRKI